MAPTLIRKRICCCQSVSAADAVVVATITIGNSPSARDETSRYWPSIGLYRRVVYSFSSNSFCWFSEAPTLIFLRMGEARQQRAVAVVHRDACAGRQRYRAEELLEMRGRDGAGHDTQEFTL